MNSSLEDLKRNIALALIEQGAVLTLDNVGHPLLITRDMGAGPETGYLLQLHREQPNEPLSPFFFNLRGPDNPGKSGNLTPEFFRLAGQTMAAVVMRDEIHCTHLVPVPNAGIPFAENMADYVFPRPELLRMEKLGNEIGGFVGEIPESGFIIGVDDLITRAKSKIPVIHRVRAAGLTMHYFVVLLDRGQGGKEGLAAEGVELLSLFDVGSLLKQAVNGKAITTAAYEAALVYLEKEAKKMATAIGS